MTDEARRVRFLSLAGGVAFAAATIGLFAVSRGKWSDALIDSGREWIVPDALARGDLLYRDVVYWFGPFTPYFHAAFFKLLGSSFRTLVVAGVVGSLGALAALYVALRRVTDLREATLWTALAIPTLVFMPNAGGSILGMGYRMWHAATFALLAVTAVSRLRSRGPLVAAVSAGILSALAGLCRTEWGIAALLACGLALGARERFDRVWLRDVFVAGTAALLLFGGVLGLFVLSAGAEAVLTDGPILLFGLPDETRNVAFAGLRSWRSGLVPLLYSSLMWIGVVLTIEVVVLRREDQKRTRKRVSLLLAILVILTVLALLARGSGAVLFSAAPLVCLASLLAGVRRRGSPEAAALTGFGLLGLLVSHRGFFHISDGPYVAPPLAIAFVSGAALLRLFVDRERDSKLRGRLQNGLLTGIGALACFAFAGRSFQYLSDVRVPIPGTEGMLSAHPSLARDITEVALAIRTHTREGEGLVVLPEGEVLNYLSGRKNPLRYKLYLPGYLTDRNEKGILREIERWKPRSIVVWPRPVGEYGGGDFGKHYGARIRGLVDKEYDFHPIRSSGGGRSRVLLAFQKE